MILVVLVVIWLESRERRLPPVSPPVAAQSTDGYLFCQWNVENLDDDTDDPANHDAIEDWYARDPDALAAKLQLLTENLLSLNGGHGPDILALAEVENRRAADLLRQSLNQRLEPDWQFPESGLIFHLNVSGRRIAPAILTRLPVRDVRVGSFGLRRILAAQIEVKDARLWVLTSHWTSRLRGEEATETKREQYAEVLYQEFLELYRKVPAVDLVISGDFNDEPDSPSVRDGLHTVDDPTLLTSSSDGPSLLNLTARLDPTQGGTYLSGRRWMIFDQIVVSPGLLDSVGWHVLPETLRIENNKEWLHRGGERGPLRFGNEKNLGRRGPSDHFAVSVRLKVNSQEGGAPAH